MFIIPSLVRKNAIKMLKKDWQTALLIVFFAEIFFTAFIVSINRIVSEDFLNTLIMGEVPAISIEQIRISLALLAVSALITPVLKLGCIRYFTLRFNDELPAFNTLFSFFKKYFKVMALYICLMLLFVLWAIVPVGLIALSIKFLPLRLISSLTPIFMLPLFYAAFRYYNAPYVFANEENIGVVSAIRKSVKMAKKAQFSLVSMVLYFVFMEMAVGFLIGALITSPIIALVISQALQLAVKTWFFASMAGLYITVNKIMEKSETSNINPDDIADIDFIKKDEDEETKDSDNKDE